MAEPLTWAIQTVGGRQVENDGSRLVNFFAINPQVPQEGRAPVILYGSPGHRNHGSEIGVATGDSTDAANRSGIYGLIPIDSPAYGRRLCGIARGNQFFQIREGVTAPDLTGFSNLQSEYYTRPARMAEDGRHVMFIRGRSIVCWDMEQNSRVGGFVPVYAPPATEGMAPVDILPDENWEDIIWIQGYFVVLAQNGRIYHSGLNSETFSQLDFATAERSPDPGVALATWGGRFYVFGTRTIEGWMNDGGVPFAFRRDRSYAIPHGCIARDTVQVDEDGISFLGHDKIFYKFKGGMPQRLSNATVEYDIARSTADTAIGYVYTEEGRRFYSLILDIPAAVREPGEPAKKNWTIDFTTGFWHERTITTILSGARHLDRNLVGLSDRSFIQEQSLFVGSAPGGGEVERIAISRLISASEQNVTFHSLWLDLPQFPQTASRGTNDDLRLDWSDDGQETWKERTWDAANMTWVESPRTRALTVRRPRFNVLGATQEGRNFRVRTRSTARVQIGAAYHHTDVQEGGYVSL